ncbi:multiple epidermal growth factor-like domains 10 [Elysia marginata]|uniref:Multiple epidermal growth factor-like domains 10 n=1 Tax=Elysia marginata TaxID=1093978 RepID=A0AAV4IVW3_9GAST|nr:multiple epidermal growth factor-like domains 10 [Elysia marginata]
MDDRAVHYTSPFLLPEVDNRSWSESRFSKTCIKAFHNKREMWPKAREICKESGGDLVKILDSSMNEFIIDRFVQPKFSDHLCAANYWVGMSNVYTNNRLRWLGTKTKPGFTDFNDPDYKLYQPEITCVYVWKFQNLSGWKGHPCHFRRRFICEMPGECYAGRYGKGCSKRCSEGCAGGETSCDRENGSCPTGCKTGYHGERCYKKCDPGRFGPYCTKTCSEHCAGKDNPCRQISGKCDHGCEPGYLGDHCDEECRSGFHSEGCTKRCSEHCAGANNSCHYVNGICRHGCHPGYNGALCDQKCSSGYFGKNCTNTCSENCAGEDNSCHHVSGTCELGCDLGYTGNLCEQECPAGYYGEGCNQTCSDHCARGDNSCHHVNGSCDLGCDPGYQGELCSELLPSHGLSKDSSYKQKGVRSGSVAAVAVCVCTVVAIALAIGVMVWRRRKTPCTPLDQTKLDVRLLPHDHIETSQEASRL